MCQFRRTHRLAKARFKVVAGIDDDRGPLDFGAHFIPVSAVGMVLTLRWDLIPRRFVSPSRPCFIDAACVVHDLTLEIGQLHAVEIHQRQFATPDAARYMAEAEPVRQHR